MNKMGEDKKPIIIVPTEPLPKYEIPSVIIKLNQRWVETFKKLYPNLISKAIFLK